MCALPPSLRGRVNAHKSRARHVPGRTRNGRKEADVTRSPNCQRAIGRCAEDALTAESRGCKLTARGAVAATPRPPQSDGPAGSARRTVPALHGDTRRRPCDRLDVQHGDRRPEAHPALARPRRSFRRDVPAMAFCTSIDVQGRIRKAGDPEVRRALYEAASAMLTRYKGKTALKSWGQKIPNAATRRRSSLWPASLPSSCTRHGATARSMRIGSTPTTCPTPRRQQRIARFWVRRHDARRAFNRKLARD